MEDSASFVVISAVEFDRRLFGGVGARGRSVGEMRSIAAAYNRRVVHYCNRSALIKSYRSQRFALSLASRV